MRPVACAPYRSRTKGKDERGVGYLITSNWAVGDSGMLLGDQVVATAILERLLHHSHVLTIRGDSYRLREKRRSGLIKATSASATAGASQQQRWLGSQCRPRMGS